MAHRHYILAAALASVMGLALTHGAFAQVTAEQQAALKSSCRSDFMSNCSGVRPGGADALQCLQKNVSKLSPGCQSAVKATLPKPAPVVAAPAPVPPPPAPAAAAAPPPAPAAPAPAITAAKPPAPSIAAPKPAAPARMTATATAAPAAPAVTAAQQSAIKSACRSDFMSNCSGVQPGGAQALQCLQKNAARLSPGCQAAVGATMPKQAAMPPAAATAPAAAPADAPPPPTAAQMSAIKNTCRGDFSRNCKGVPLGGPEAIACLQGNAAKLSPNCKISLADIADTGLPTAPTAPVTQRPNAPVVMTAVIGRACLRDLVRRCRNTGVGDGQKIACLQAHEADLAPLCKVALKGTAPIR